MKKPQDIVALIRSLSMSEKRYFKLFVAKNSIGESSHYLKLFDLIDKAGTTERKVIHNLYKDEAFMKQGFSTYKHLLYNQLLKSLSSYHSSKSVDDKILESIKQSRILFNKALYSHAVNILENAKTIASKYEKMPLLLEIIHWQKKIIKAWTLIEKPHEEVVNQIFEEENKMINKMSNANDHWRLSALTYLTYHMHGGARIQEDIDKINTFINIPVLKNQEVAMSYQAKTDFYATFQNYFLVINNLKEAYVYAKSHVEFMETHPHQIEDNPTQYFTALYNLLFIAKKLRKYDTFFHLIHKYKEIQGKFSFPPLPTLIRIYNIEFSTYIDIGQLKKAARLIPQMEALLYEKPSKNGLAERVFIANLVLLNYATGEYHKALININIWLNDQQNQANPGQYSSMRVLQLIIHLDKGNVDLLPYLLKSLYRYLMQRKQLYEAEKIFLRFIRTIFNSKKTMRGQQEDFRSLKEELQTVCDDPMEANFLDVFNFISWLESKIENRPFVEILMEKSGYTIEEDNS